ncbi:hypothetical protein [Singulisphaera sp. PoT]|uniref:hypothetical protein n=1 Tax=Singulisphaera sp. PoT TaxID=3411797 RepID=UPI003BF5907C
MFTDATSTFNDHGIRFDYPADWEVEIDEEETVTTVSLQSPGGLAFALVTVDETCPAPAEVADEALNAMREEYPDLEAAPALETLAGQRAVGHDVEFISLDMTNTCAIRCFRTPRRTVLVFGQWSDIEAEESAAQIQGLRRSLEETDQ